jgi:hypothetical protein
MAAKSVASPLRRTGLCEKFVLTYDNTKKTDGVGAQLQRIYGIYALSRFLGVPYLHSPLGCVDYQGLRALERNRADPELHHELNDLCRIKSDVRATDNFRTISLLDLTMEKLDELVATCDADKSDSAPYLLRLVMPYGIVDRFPDCYEVCKEISPFTLSAGDSRTVRVAVHVRRGDLLILDQDRMLPNSYYVSVAQNVAHALERCRSITKSSSTPRLPTMNLSFSRNIMGFSIESAPPPRSAQR